MAADNIFSPFIGFLLYSDGTSEDHKAVERYFQDHGITFYRMQDIPFGVDSWEDYKEAIEETALIIVLASSRHPFKGFEYERSYSKPTIVFAFDDPAVLVEDTKKVSTIVRAKHSPPDQQDLDDLLAAYQAAVDGLKRGVKTTSHATLTPLEQRLVGSSGNLLRVFLCHSSGDKPAVRDLYRKLRQAAGIDPWLDEEKLMAGQEWELEIRRAVKNSDVVLVCLSKDSINKRGYVQKEIKQALDVAQEIPEGEVFIIPVRLEPCKVPESLSRWQWVDLFVDSGYDNLLRALNQRARSLAAGG